MLYLILSVTAIVLSYIASIENNKRCAILTRYAFAIVFFIYGFEYYNTVDYDVMLRKFNYVNYGTLMHSMYGDEVEPLTRILMKLCKPIGNIGYYIIVAFFEIIVLYKMAIKYVPKQYLWLFFILLLINFDNVILLMTVKRQVLSLFVVWLGVYYLLNVEKRNNTRIGTLLIISACFIHTASIFALLILPIVRYNYLPSRQTRITLFIIFFAQFFVNISTYTDFLYNYIFGINEKFASYANDLQGDIDITPAYFIYYLSTFYIILFNLDKLNKTELALAKFVILYYLIFNLLPNSAGRSLMYFNLFQLFVIPIIVSKINDFRIMNLKVKYTYIALVVIISLRLCTNVYISDDPTNIGNGFKKFNTIFEAPSLQIDDPSFEKNKFKDLRK